MTTLTLRSRRHAFAKAAFAWLLFWLSLGGFFLYKAAPKEGPAEDAGVQPALGQSAQVPEAHARTKNIEDVQVGDRVWAYDPHSGKWEPKEVIKPLTHEYEGDLVTVTVAGRTVQATGNHPFWVEAGTDLDSRPWAEDLPWADRLRPTRGRWVDARHLQAGDELVLRDGGLAPIEMVSVQRTRQTVYNLKVADLHTYAVGEAGIAVHNKPCFPPGTQVLMGDGTTKAIEKIELGDTVLAREPEAGGPARPAEVSGLIRDFASNIVHVKIGSSAATTSQFTPTRHHLCWTSNRGWVEAQQLEPGDALVDDQQIPRPVIAVTVERRPTRSYNLSVEGVHTFYALAVDGPPILVHNQSLPNRSEALNIARDRGGIPNSQQPYFQFEAGNDSSRAASTNYFYTQNPTEFGRYYVYSTPAGDRVIADHVADPSRGPHLHIGEPLEGTTFNKGDEYRQVGGKDHIEYESESQSD